MAVPRELKRWVKHYDPQLDIRQDEPTGRATLLHGGRPVCVLKHEDGAPIRNLDLCAPMVRDIVRKCDQNANGRRMTRFIVDRTLEKERSRQRQSERQTEDGRAAAKDIMRHRRYGPKVTVGPATP